MSHFRKKHSKQTKFEAVLALIKGDLTISEICQKYTIHQSVLHRWKKEFMEKGADIFDTKFPGKKSDDTTVEHLQRKIGELTMDIDFLKKNL